MCDAQPVQSPPRPGPRLRVALLLLAVLPGFATAIPAWARKYRTSCATCHEAFPRLTATGEAFRLNGYRFADDESLRKEEPVEMGDEAYRKVWPDAIWPTTIAGTAPFGLRILSDITLDLGGANAWHTSFDAPREASLLGGGALGDDLSCFVAVVFVNDPARLTTELFGWLQFEDLLGPDNLFNLKLGSVGWQERGLYTARPHNRVTRDSYLYTEWTMPAPDSFEVPNGHLLQVEPGLELHGFGSRWRYALGVSNGVATTQDDNDRKNVYSQLAWKIGGLGLDGSDGPSVAAGQAAPAQPWRDDSLTLSVFGYTGASTVNATGFAPDARDDKFDRIGVGARWKWADLALGGGFIAGRNRNPFGTLDQSSVRSRSYFVEAEYFVFPWLLPNVRYETLDLTLPDTIPGLDPTQDRARVILSTRAMVRANVALVVEARLHTRDQRFSQNNDDNLFVLQVDFAF